MRNPSSEAASGKGKDLTCSKKIGLKRGPWTPEEDTLLASFVRREGEGKWRTLPRRAGLLRCGKSCRLRWMNYLRPSVKRGQIEPDEEDLILRLHRLLGNRWSLIAGRLPGRTDNEIKNYWNTHLSKRLISQGIDPRTHKSLNAEIPSASHQKDHAQAPTVAPANPNPNFHPKPSATRQNSGDLNSALHRQEDSCFFFERADLEQRTAWQNFDGSSREALPNQNVENETEFCNDELFASFLESLVGDDVFQHVPPGPPVFQVPAYGGHTLWDPASDASPAVPLDRNYSFPPTEDRNKQI